MDALTREFYEMKFKLAFFEKKGNEFQDFFADIMEKVHPANFMRVRPWGKAGDRKNDGYLKSARTLFQVYAPNEIKPSSTIAKIDEDFRGALPFWEVHFDRWVFVHNSASGLGPDVTKTLLDLAKAHPAISVQSWGQEELRQKVFALNAHDLASLFGSAPTSRDMRELGLEVLAPVLDQIGRLPAPPTPDLRPPPADKITRNMLSESIELLLKAGMGRADLVKKYFRAQPTHQDEIAESFRVRYRQLRSEGMAPDRIFPELQKFAGGDTVGTGSHQAAVLAVLAFFFEECEIYERDTGSTS